MVSHSSLSKWNDLFWMVPVGTSRNPSQAPQPKVAAWPFAGRSISISTTSPSMISASSRIRTPMDLRKASKKQRKNVKPQKNNLKKEKNEKWSANFGDSCGLFFGTLSSNFWVHWINIHVKFKLNCLEEKGVFWKQGLQENQTCRVAQSRSRIQFASLTCQSLISSPDTEAAPV